MIEVGKQCALKDCNQLDFLPFQCKECSKSFCQNHRYQNDHACEKLNLNKHQIDIHNETKKANKCPVKGCKNVLTIVNEFICQTCQLKVCLTHRFEEAHECKQSNVILNIQKPQPQKPIVEIKQKEDKPKNKSSFFCCFSGKPKNLEKKSKQKNAKEQIKTN